MHRLSIALLMLAGACQRAAEPGRNPHPIHLVRPAMAPLSAVALAGRQLFFDTTLSASGHASCATCHNPAAAYAAPNALAVQPGGADGRGTGIRAVPSLRYTDRTPEFFIGPDDGVAENVNVTQLALQNAGTTRAPKTVGSTASATAMVPRGGLFWDGRVNTLQDQAMGPLFNVAEMANHRVADAAARIRATPAAAVLVQLFGAAILHSPARLVDEAMFAIARFEVEDPSFHPYTSRYDRYLEGTATLTATELRGLAAFEDTARGNCAGCHLDKAGRDGRPPVFTDDQYEALGVPRNATIAANRDPMFFDLGLCGPLRTDLAPQRQYCGMFRTPTLRNVAIRRVFFHNGVYRTLEQVLDFYALRAPRPDSIYPRRADGSLALFDDVPAADHGSIDVLDPPFNRLAGTPAVLSRNDRSDIIAFLRTLTDSTP